MQSTLTRVWAEKGQELIKEVKQGYKSFYIYSSVSPVDGEDFTLILPGINTELMNLYLEHLSEKYKDKSILMIMDQAGWHKAKSLNISDYNIKFLYLPPYSPELNPVERLWKWLKKEVLHNVIYLTIDTLMENVSDCYRKISNNRFKSLCACNYL